MILFAHGRFDHADDPDSAIELMAEECRTFHDPVKTIECEGVIEASDIENREQVFAFVGYSNGGPQILNIAREMNGGTLIEIALMILIDPVVQSVWDQIFNNELWLPSNVRHCVTYIRADRFKPEMAMWAPNHEVIPIAVDHGAMPYAAKEDAMLRLRRAVSGSLPEMGQT